MLKTSFYLIVTALVGLLVFKLTENGATSHKILLQDWAKNKIVSETAYFQSNHFGKDDVDKTYKDLSAIAGNILIRFHIEQNTISTSAIDESNIEMVNAYKAFHKFFSHMVKKYPIDTKVDFIVSIADTISVPENYVFTAPIIVPSKYTNTTYAKFLLLAPHYKTVDEWPKIYDDMLDANNHYPWARKVEKAFWRGGANISSLTRSNWQDFSILKLVELSNQNPTLIDAQLTNISQSDGEIQRLLAEKYPLAVNTSMLEYTKYKINIKMDDKAATYPGFVSMLLASGLVLKEESDNVEWFYDILQPQKHYISFSNDLSDLLPKVQWIYSNDSEAKKIADMGTSLIQKEITPEHLSLYWSGLLKVYATMQK